MRLQWLRFCLLCCVLWLSLSTAHAQQTLYAATSIACCETGAGGNLYTIDATTGAYTLVGPLLAGGLPIGITGLAFNPVTGVLFGVTDDNSANYPDSLVTINTSTAAAKLIGPLGLTGISDISFSSTGTLYGWVAQSPASYLVSINLTTGAATQIGPGETLYTVAGGLAFSPAGTLYLLANLTPYPETGVLGTIDPTTGSVTFYGAETDQEDRIFNAAAFNSAGTLFASSYDSDLGNAIFTVDPTTGANNYLTSLPTVVFGEIADALAFTPVTVSPTFLLRYVSNLNIGDSNINVTNDGQNTLVPDPVGDGNLCVGVYAFDPNEELQSCCSCLVTPDGLVSLSAKAINAASLTGENPTSLVIKLLAWSTAAGASSTAPPGTPAPPNSSACNAGSPGPVVSGLHAWGTTLHALPASGYTVSETPFSTARLSAAELAHLTQACEFNQINGSGQFGQCPGCVTGGQ